MKLATLGDIVGKGRDELVAAWCLCLLDNHVKRGTISGPKIDLEPAWSIVSRCLESGMDPPSDYEVAVGFVFVRAAHPDFKLTARGEAAHDFIAMHKNAGRG